MIYSLDERTPVLEGDNFVAPNAAVIGSVLMKKGANVWWGCTLRGDNDLITLGENVNVQDGSVIHTDLGLPCTLERNVSVGHMVMLHGCTIGDGILIGIGAIVLNNAVIGRECLIGANALIPENKVIPDRSLVMGSPGRVVRQLTDEDIAAIQDGNHHYVENIQHYRDGLTRLD